MHKRARFLAIEGNKGTMNTFNYAELREIEKTAANANSWNPAVSR